MIEQLLQTVKDWFNEPVIIVSITLIIFTNFII
jgi:hypothetical protein